MKTLYAFVWWDYVQDHGDRIEPLKAVRKSLHNEKSYEYVDGSGYDIADSLLILELEVDKT